MTLKGIFGYGNTDASLDYNARTARVIDRAILEGGALSYNGNFTVNIAPFIAHSYDGMTVISDTSVTVTLIDGAVNYIICFAQYQTAAAPVVEIQVINEAAWLSLTNRAYFITFAKFDLFTGAPHILADASNADYSVSDYSDKLGKGNWRTVAATQGTLPTAQNRDGDTRIALDDRISYTWNGTLKIWSPTKTKAAQVTFAAYPGISSLDVQAAIQELKGNIINPASNALISDRVIYSTYTTGPFKFHVPFIRKFLVAPASVNITTILGDEANVASATVTAITTNGFTVSVTPTITGMTTLARDWVTI